MNSKLTCDATVKEFYRYFVLEKNCCRAAKYKVVISQTGTESTFDRIVCKTHKNQLERKSKISNRFSIKTITIIENEERNL